MASIAEQRIPGRHGIDAAAWPIAIMLGLAGILALYLSYAEASPFYVMTGAVLLIAALTLGIQLRRRARAPAVDGTALMHAIADSLPQALVVRNERGEVVFSNKTAQQAPGKSAAGMTRFPWRDADGRLLGWVEMGSAERHAATEPLLSEQDVESLIVQRTEQMRELIAHAERCHEEEKRLLARRVHGELGSSLTALSLHLAMLSRQLPDTPAVQERVREMKQFLGAAANVSRQIQSGLRPDKLELFGMKAAIEDLADSVSQSSGMAFHLDLPEEPLSCPSLEIALYRMLEQVLENVARHAYATRVDIMMKQAQGQLMVEVRDNGVGFDPRETVAGAYGLCSLRERTLALGGHAAIHSAPGQGARVCIRLPLPARAEALQAVS